MEQIRGLKEHTAAQALWVNSLQTEVQGLRSESVKTGMPLGLPHSAPVVAPVSQRTSQQADRIGEDLVLSIRGLDRITQRLESKLAAAGDQDREIVHLAAEVLVFDTHCNLHPPSAALDPAALGLLGPLTEINETVCTPLPASQLAKRAASYSLLRSLLCCRACCLPYWFLRCLW